MGKKILLVAVWVTLLFSGLSAQTAEEKGYADSLEFNIQLLKRYLSHGENWFFTDPLTEKRLAGIIHFIENEPIDTILLHLKRVHAADSLAIVWREAENTPDSLNAPGYVSHRQALRALQTIDEEVNKEFMGRPITVPIEIMAAGLREVPLIPEGQGLQLFTDKIYRMPDSLKILDAIPEDMIQSSRDFRRILRLDSIRSRLAEQKRLHYNDSLLLVAREKITNEYRKQLIEERSAFLKSQKTDEIRRYNRGVLTEYNNRAIRNANDSIRSAMNWLSGFADLIDNTTINLVNLSKASAPLVLSNSGQFFTRVWLKNQQNDSLAVLIQNLDKRSIQMAIEDGVTFSRFKQQAVKDFDFRTLNQPSVSLDKLSKRFQAYTPWTIGGDGTLGFTQTYLSNWKKGGKSALSILVVARGFANYSAEKFKWENSAEIRNGWIKPGEDKLQKTDDKVEFTSRIGISAFKKWYYSAEADFETQFFNGYKYPDRTKVISGFLGPGKFLFKIGMDYKPNKNFSLFISPITSKYVLVRDTLKINKASFGIKPGQNYYWEPGLNTDLKWVKTIMTGITYETKYRMFMNYLQPFQQIDIDWENILRMQVNSYINVQVMAHSIYDSKVLFEKLGSDGKPVLDANGKKVLERKLQFKEFISIGFTYKINHRVVRAREIK